MKLDIIHHFAERADSYDKAEWVRDAAVMSATLELLGLCPGRRILDVGAGTGAVLEAALAACPSLGECVALDISHEMLSHIRDRRIRTCCHDAETLPFADGRFDIVVCRQMLHYMDAVDRCLQEIHRVLDREGALVVGQMTPFGEADEAWWKAIVEARQPLRRHDLTLHELLDLLMRAAFTVVKVSQIRATESLNSWLGRYERSARQIAEVRRLHLEAPESYKEIHRFRCVGDDIVLDNCWTVIRACRA
jgi:ubiquinone/menaquinone biosynthesis C-methylase UbiE